MEYLVHGLKDNVFSCTVIGLFRPKEGDIDTIRLIRSASHATPLVGMVDSCDILTAVGIMKAGASDLITGEPDKPTLSLRIRGVIDANSELISKCPPQDEAARRLRRLSHRELELVRLICAGYHNREITSVFGLSCRAV